MRKKLLSILVASSTATMVCSGSAFAQSDDHNSEMGHDKHMQDMAHDSGSRDHDPLAGHEDDTSLTVNGTVGQVNDDDFTLRTSTGSIRVESDDVFDDENMYSLASGDRVTVYGEVDDGFFESRKLEADAIRVDKVDVTFTTRDEPVDGYTYTSSSGETGDVAELNGRITAIDDDEFAISSGTGQTTVSVEGLDNNPLDDQGYLKLDVGDQVRVKGEMTDGWFDEREFKATSLNAIR